MDGATHQRRILLWNNSHRPAGGGGSKQTTNSSIPPHKPRRTLFFKNLSFRAIKRRLTEPSDSLEDFEMRGFGDTRQALSCMAPSSRSSPCICKGTRDCWQLTSSSGSQKGCLKISSHIDSLNRSYYESSLTSANSVETEGNVKPVVLASIGSRPDKPSRQTPPPRSVRFSTVQILEHSRRLGDNPSVSSGPPVALGRRLISSSTHEVDSYESSRIPKPKAALVLSRLDRIDLLKECGYGRSDFAVAEQELSKVKHQRQLSAKVSIAERAWSNVKNRIGDNKPSRSSLRVNDPDGRVD